LLVAAVMLTVFVLLELRRASAARAVVFDFGDLRHRGFRYGLINTTVLAMGEFGAFFVLPLFLQAGLHKSAVTTGSWLLPAGVMAFAGGAVGGQLSKRFGPKYVITVGLAFEAAGIFLYVAAFSTSTTFWSLLPGLLLHGIGIGFATSQLTNVVLSDIPPQKSGAASGAAGMVRQVGTALGIALIGAIFVSQAASRVRDDLARVPGIPPAVREEIATRVNEGVGGGAATQLPPGIDAAQVGGAISDAVSGASRPAVAFAGAVVTVGALLSLLVPNIPPDAEPGAAADAGDDDERRRPAPLPT
jgi:nitrate/nitrite transporter NarK